MTFERTARNRRNPDLELLLDEINTLLEPVQLQVNSTIVPSRYPVIFVVGAPRSGTTLLMQWLADNGRFAYPSNLMSRFYSSPYVGAKIQLLLTDDKYNFNDEFVEFRQKKHPDFQSDLGKTRGVLAPNEFWYFWRRFIPNTEPRYLTGPEERRIRGKELACELASIEAVFDKPVALKAMILQFNIPALSSFFGKALFLFIRRDPLYNIQSLLESRENYYGDLNAWYSVKPREYDRLKNLGPVSQVAGQIHYTNLAIEQGLGAIDPVRSLSITYEAFCDHPEAVYQRIADNLEKQGTPLDRKYQGPRRFDCANQLRMDAKTVEEIRKALRKTASH